MKKYYIYILKSKKDGNLYIGVTGNVTQRVLRHNEGRIRSTKSRRPLALVHVEELASMGDALKREKYLKGLKNTAYLKRYIIRPDSSIG